VEKCRGFESQTRRKICEHMSHLSILIADDHPVFRRGTRDVLNESLSPLIIGEAENGREMLALVRQKAWDVCIMDVSMPDKSGTDLLQEVLSIRPSMPVLVLSMHPEKVYAVRMFRAGASGYLNKSTTKPAQLMEAIKSVVAGRKFITPSSAECLATTVRTGSHFNGLSHELLSNREFQILKMLSDGKQIKEIAAELYVSPATISTYRARVLQKLGLESNADLIRYAIEHSLFV
jgi:two-component system, NarL family, invasion response regulator UvrY